MCEDSEEHAEKDAEQDEQNAEEHECLAVFFVLVLLFSLLFLPLLVVFFRKALLFDSLDDLGL